MGGFWKVCQRLVRGLWRGESWSEECTWAKLLSAVADRETSVWGSVGTRTYTSVTNTTPSWQDSGICYTTSGNTWPAPDLSLLNIYILYWSWLIPLESRKRFAHVLRSSPELRRRCLAERLPPFWFLFHVVIFIVSMTVSHRLGNLVLFVFPPIRDSHSLRWAV